MTTTSTTTTTSSRVLQRQEALQYIRTQNITLKVKGARPDTVLYVFFDEVNVTSMCTSIYGNVCKTDSEGEVDIYFHIPSSTFTVGVKQIVVADTDNLFLINVPGTTNGSSKGMFAATARIDFYQTTSVTTVNTLIQDIVYDYKHADNPNPPAVVTPVVVTPVVQPPSYSSYGAPSYEVPPPSQPSTTSIPFANINKALGTNYSETEISNLIQRANGITPTNVTKDIGSNSGTVTSQDTTGSNLGGIYNRVDSWHPSEEQRNYTYLPSNIVNQVGQDKLIKDYFENALKACKTQDPLAQ